MYYEMRDHSGYICYTAVVIDGQAFLSGRGGRVMCRYHFPPAPGETVEQRLLRIAATQELSLHLVRDEQVGAYSHMLSSTGYFVQRITRISQIAKEESR
jgi:hypothetical protein